MKLKLLILYSQRDPQWNDILLGYNTQSQYTIGLYGCLITTFGNYIGKTPIEVNDILKANNGFVDGSGELVWSTVSYLGLKQTYLSPNYTGPVTDQGIAKIKEFLDDGFPLVCEIDFNPATEGEEQHFVLLMGYEDDQIFCADPWTGQIVSLDVYGGAKRAIIRFRVYDKQLPIDDGTTTVPVDSKIFENLVRKATIYDKARAKMNVEDSETVFLSELEQLIGYEDKVRQQEGQIKEAVDKAAGLEGKLKDLTDQHTKLQQDYDTLMENAKKWKEAFDQHGTAVTDATTEVAEIKETANVPILTGWRKWLYDLLIGRR